MKNNISNSIIISVIFNVICFLINIISAFLYGILPLSKTIPGGDCIDHIGFGIRLFEIFPKTTYESVGNIKEISFHPLSILISIICIFIISLIIFTLISKLRKEK